MALDRLDDDALDLDLLLLGHPKSPPCMANRISPQLVREAIGASAPRERVGTVAAL
jgi:hypothetical protein